MLKQRKLIQFDVVVLVTNWQRTHGLGGGIGMNWDSLLVQETSIAGDGRLYILHSLNPRCSESKRLWLMQFWLQSGTWMPSTTRHRAVWWRWLWLSDNATPCSNFLGTFVMFRVFLPRLAVCWSRAGSSFSVGNAPWVWGDESCQDWGFWFQDLH